MNFFRFLSNDIGVYEAVDKDCPRDDLRRSLKPDGRWLPKVGENYHGAISFWTNNGLKKYMESGLQEWHRSVLTNPLEVLVLDNPNNILYEDEFQIICSKEQNTTLLDWDIFCSKFDQYPIIDKVVTYIIRNNNDKKEILVFEHDKEWSEAGIQVPAGSVDPDENIESAAVREAQEESGLGKLKIIKKVDEYLMFRNTHNQFNRRHVYQLEVLDEKVNEKWSHIVSGDGIDRGMNFTYYWIPLEKAESSLTGSMGCSIRKLL